MIRRSTTCKMALLLTFSLALGACDDGHGKGTGGNDGDPMAVYEQFVAACKAKDAESLWLLLGTRLRSQISSLATDMQQLGAEDLAEAYGFQGKVEDFDGKAYLAGIMKRDQKGSNVCYGAKGWKVTESGRQGELFVVAIKRPDELVQGVKLHKRSDRWVIFDITKPLSMPK